MDKAFWPAVVVAVLGLFWLVAGGGPSIVLPILVLLVGIVGAVLARRARASSPSN